MSNDVAFEAQHLSIQDIISLKDDINFDGYKDLQVLSVAAATNQCYNYLVYNPYNKKFEGNKILNVLCGPSFNSKEKTITTYITNGCVGGNSSWATLSFINGKYVLTETKEMYCCDFGETSENGKGVFINTYKDGELLEEKKESCP